jgi:hypothetical protein
MDKCMPRALFLIFALISAATFFSSPASAQALGLSNLVLDSQGGRIIVRFGVDVKDQDSVRGALENGQELALVCSARLSLKRDLALDKEMARAEQWSALTLHDKGPFEIILDQGRQERFRGRDLLLLMREAWGHMSLDLGGRELLERGRAYSLTLEIRLVRKDVSPWLKGALFFLNFDAAPPVKYQLDFSY